MKKVRQIIRIDEDKCTGCGHCVTGCAKGALEIVNGKAKLVSDNFCDGIGICIGGCPTGALTIEEREADIFDKGAVKTEKRAPIAAKHKVACGCPSVAFDEGDSPAKTSALRQWPIQIQLVSPRAPFLKDANLVIAADCCAYAYPKFYEDFLRKNTILIGCPKLDDIQFYEQHLTSIFQENDLSSVTVVRMEVPCCMGLTQVAQNAIKHSGKHLPFVEIVLSRDGRILE